MPTGRADCDSTSAPMLRAGRAERHPHADLPGALLDEIREHAEQPRQRQQKRQRSKHQRQPERNRQKIRFRARDGPQRRDLAHVGIDRRQPIDERMARALGIAAHTQRERRPGSLGADRHVDTGARQPEAAQPKARHVAGDADDDEAAREQRRRRSGSPRFGSSGPARAAGPARRRRCPATAGARRFRTRPPPRRLRSARSAVKPRPRTRSMPRTPKYSGETNWYVTVDLPLAPSGERRRAPPSTPGHEAATEATDGSLFTTSRMAPRLCSFRTLTMTIPAVRIPGSTVAAAHELRRKMAAQMRSSTDPVTCSATSAFRARPGRASRTTSPRIARTSSTRVA